MNKNTIKFFLLTTFILLISVSLVSAIDMANDTSADIGVVSADNNVKNVDKTELKSDKLSDNEINYYVSDTSGSDNNTGTSSSPFKTIQTALNKTTSTGVYNIYIGAGTYKGVGNTNLTVNGSHTINLIGSGVNSTILDGEVSYTIKGGTVWGAEDYWNPYTINYGNWGLNITQGNGKITISDLNIQNMVSPGGTSISLYETAPIDNYGNLELNNIYSHHNLAGVGAGIRNNYNATVLINNSIFEANRKSSSSGNYGSGIYNNGTAIINNTQFIRNAGRWGVITNDRTLNISNSIIRDGISYDLGSGYKSGSGISINTGTSDYFNSYTVDNINTNVYNCTFYNNSQTDIHQLNGNLTVDTSIFNNSAGIWLYNAKNYSSNISNCIFIGAKSSSLYGDLSGTNLQKYSIYNSIGNVTINNNTFNSSGYLRIGDYGVITNNNITTKSDYSIYLVNKTGNIVAGNYIESNLFYGNNAVKDIANNIVENNTPNMTKGVIITEETYNNYFNNENILENVNSRDNVIYFSGNITNKKFIFNNDFDLTITNKDEINLINCSIELRGNGRTDITNISMTSINDTKEYLILVNSTNNAIENSKFYVNTTNTIHTIKITKDNNLITGNNITTSGPANNIQYDQNNYGTSDTISILINSNNNRIHNNNITTTYTTKNGQNNTIIAISIQSQNNTTKDNKITANEITITGDQYTYAINIINSHNNIITQNTTKDGSIPNFIYAYGNNNTYGIQLSGNVTNNTVNASMILNSPKAYGIVIDGYVQANNNNLAGLRRLNITSDEATGIMLINTTNTNLNAVINLYLYSDKAVGILLNHSSDVNLNASGIDSYNPSEENIAYLVINSQNINMNGSRIRSNMGTGIKIINSTNIDIQPIVRQMGTRIFVQRTVLISNLSSIEDCEYPTHGIIVENSKNVKINNISLNSTKEAIILNNTNDSYVNNSYLLQNNTINADNAIKTFNVGNVNLTLNRPEVLSFNDTTYNNYFTDGVLTLGVNSAIISLESDLYNKDLIFPIMVEFYGNNHTLYNGTIKFINNSAKSVIHNLNLNSTDNRTTLIDTNTTGIFRIYDSIIYHKNTNSTILTIKGYNEGLNIYNSTIIVEGVELETTDNTPSITVLNNTNIYDSNITLTTSNNTKDGKVLFAIKGEIIGSNINITGNNVRILNNTDLINSTLNAFGKNQVIIEDIQFNTDPHYNIGNNNISLYGENVVYGFIIHDSYYNPNSVGLFSLGLFSNNFLIKSNNTGAIILYDNVTCYADLPLIGNNTGYMYGVNVDGIIIKNSILNLMSYGIGTNIISINDTDDLEHIPLRIINSTNVIINSIIVKNQIYHKNLSIHFSTNELL